jgi:hypothetical protein
MKLTRRTLAAWALAATALLAAAPAAHAAAGAAAAPSYVTGYHYYEGYSYNPSYGSSAFVRFHATNSRTQVWINGSGACAGFNGALVYWCGHTGNGTNTLVFGVNYRVNGQVFYYRLVVYAPVWYGNVVCQVRGNAGVRAITYCAA